MAFKKIPTSFSCIVAIILVLIALKFLPDWTHPRQFDFPAGGDAASSVQAFPIDTVLPIVSGHKDNLKETTLRKLAQQSPGGIVVNFWATWCPPCIEELPSLEYLNRQLKSNTEPHVPKLVTISVDETREAIASLYKTLDFHPSFLVLHDKVGEVAKSVGTTKFPETYWINSQGKILYKWVGPQNWLGNEVLKTLSLLSRG